MTDHHQRGQAAGPVAWPPPEVGPAADPQPSTAGAYPTPPHMAADTGIRRIAAAYRAAAELSAEQDIRTRALTAAVSLLAGCAIGDDEVLALCQRFATYIAVGANPTPAQIVEEPRSTEVED